VEREDGQLQKTESVVGIDLREYYLGASGAVSGAGPHPERKRQGSVMSLGSLLEHVFCPRSDNARILCDGIELKSLKSSFRPSCPGQIPMISETEVFQSFALHQLLLKLPDEAGHWERSRRPITFR
jgi:hypothetical protein